MVSTIYQHGPCAKKETIKFLKMECALEKQNKTGNIPGSNNIYQLMKECL